MNDTTSINVSKTTSNYTFDFTGDMNGSNLINIGPGGSGPNAI